LNGGFENLPVSVYDYEIINASDLEGWSTTATDGKVEIWEDGFEDVDAAEGDYFIELNANEVSTVYQTFDITPGAVIVWSLYHGKRDNSGDPEKIRVYIGDLSDPGVPIDSSLNYVKGTWKFLSGVYKVPPGQNKVTFFFESVLAPGGKTYGNFIDGVSFIETQRSCLSNRPTVSISGLACSGSTVSENGGDAVRWQWSGPNGFSATTQSVTIPQSDIGDQYIVTGINAIGASAKDTVTVGQNSEGFSVRNNGPLCPGQILHLYGESSEEASWMWSIPGGLVSCVKNPEISPVPFGTYSVSATNSSGCTEKTTFTVTQSGNCPPPTTPSGR